jgi:hypothetical protein
MVRLQKRLQASMGPVPAAGAYDRLVRGRPSYRPTSPALSTPMQFVVDRQDELVWLRNAFRLKVAPELFATLKRLESLL